MEKLTDDEVNSIKNKLADSIGAIANDSKVEPDKWHLFTAKFRLQCSGLVIHLEDMSIVCIQVDDNERKVT